MNMNLSTEQTSDFGQQKRTSSGGLIVVTIFFILTVIVTGVLLLWKSNLKKQMGEAEKAYNEKYIQLTKEERNKDVVDFQNRISMAKELIGEKNMALDSLQFVERNIVSGIYLTGYSNDKNKKTLNLEGVAENFDAIARQTLSFKSSNLFSSVDVAEVGLSPEGKIIFSMEIKIN